jgi:hypothetical protein
MRETLKVLSVIVFMIAAPTAAIAWTDDQPSFVVSILKYACPILSILAIATFLRIHFRADEVPDYLRLQVGTYFSRGGFSFAFKPTAVAGVCYFDIYFQNNQDAPCIGRIALRPARGFFLGRAKLETIAFEIRCEPAAYGIARFPIAIPANLQGKKQSFEVGASVDQPQGKGHTLRFREGIILRANTKFGNVFGTGLTIAYAITGGGIYLSRPATVVIELPTGVAEEAPGDLRPDIRTLWKLGDPPLQSLA